MRVLIMRGGGGGETSPTTHTNYANCRMHHYGAQCSVHQVRPFHHPSRNILVHPFARPRAERVELREKEEEKLEGQRERERESIALPSARPQTSTVVDLAEHFNDSSLPRAFTVPAVARLGQQSVHARSMKQLLNNWASRCAPFCLFFTPLLISHTIVIYVPPPSPLLSTRSFTVSFLLSVLPSRFSIRKKKKKKK